MQSPDLQALIELSHRATGGVWRWSENGNIVTDVPDADCGPEIAAVYSEHMDVDAADTSEPANAAFIAALVNWFRANHSTLTAPTLPGAGGGDDTERLLAHWKVGRFYDSDDKTRTVLSLAVGSSEIEEYGAHHSFCEWVYAHAPIAPASECALAAVRCGIGERAPKAFPPKEFEEWFLGVETGDGEIPIPQSVVDGEAYHAHIGRRQMALGAWLAATEIALSSETKRNDERYRFLRDGGAGHLQVYREVEELSLLPEELDAAIDAATTPPPAELGRVS